MIGPCGFFSHIIPVAVVLATRFGAPRPKATQQTSTQPRKANESMRSSMQIGNRWERFGGTQDFLYVT